MELRHLRYFVTVAAEAHFGRAAQRLVVSQPALSQQIRGLEGELGLRLFARDRRGVRLTPEGAAFLAKAEAVVRQADRATEVARALAQGATGQLRLSHLRTMPRGLPERLVGEYQRRYPGVEIIPESGSTEQNVERLRGGHVDLAFVLTPLDDIAGLACVDIAAEPIVVALPSGHPLCRRRRIKREDVASVPLVYYPRHNSPGFYDSSLSQVYGTDPPEIVRADLPTRNRPAHSASSSASRPAWPPAASLTLRGSWATSRRRTRPAASDKPALSQDRHFVWDAGWVGAV